MSKPKSQLPIEVDAASGPHPLGMLPAQFLRDYWQKRPLLIRNAFPGFVSSLEPEDLAGLACEHSGLQPFAACMTLGSMHDNCGFHGSRACAAVSALFR